ncbi:hypothetical protein ACLB2K_028596 [Fragaria x ananassa]
MEKKFFGVALFFIILLTSQEMVMHCEAAICKVPSKTFKGMCFSQKNCIVRCHSEGYGWGECSHLRRRCMCYKPC